MEVVSADSNGVVGIHPQQPELGATWQIHFKMACVFFGLIILFLQICKHFLSLFLTELLCSISNFLSPATVSDIWGSGMVVGMGCSVEGEGGM